MLICLFHLKTEILRNKAVKMSKHPREILCLLIYLLDENVMIKKTNLRSVYGNIEYLDNLILLKLANR